MKKHNILLILADQLRQDYCGCYGADFIKTPNIDSLAESGVMYCDALSPNPICVPARASLMTGKSALENRVLDNFKWIRPDHGKMGVKTWAEILSDNDYRTVGVGKMHFYPWNISEGFDYRIIAEDKRHVKIQDDYTYFLKRHGYERLAANTYENYVSSGGAIINKVPHEYNIDKFVADEACKMLESFSKEENFAMMVGFPGPHCPYDPTLETLEKVEGEMPKAYQSTDATDTFRAENIAAFKRPWNGVDITTFPEEQKDKVRRHYSALVQTIDEYVGNIVAKLKERGLYDNTIIIFSSDHGDFLGDYNLLGKHYFYNPSMQIPMIIRHPDFGHCEVSETVSLTDLYSTMLNFAGVETESTTDSFNLYPFGEEKERGYVFGSTNIGWMLRDENFEYTRYSNGLVELYDMKCDKTHQNNLAGKGEYREKEMEMSEVIFQRALTAINNSSMDNFAKCDTFDDAKNRFDYESWQRTYPYKANK